MSRSRNDSDNPSSEYERSVASESYETSSRSLVTSYTETSAPTVWVDVILDFQDEDAKKEVVLDNLRLDEKDKNDMEDPLGVLPSITYQSRVRLS